MCSLGTVLGVSHPTTSLSLLWETLRSDLHCGAHGGSVVSLSCGTPLLG
jgi:hypothetical protein